MQTIIKTQNLTKKYGNYAANNQVNFTLMDGEIYGLIGKNGAGKSTLIKLLMGLSNRTTGEIEINRQSSKSGLEKERFKIGFMLEPAFFPYLNPRQNLTYFAKLKGIKDQQEIQRVLKLVEMDTVSKPFKAFSMGMKQRLALANALLGDPHILILDEPINGLDPEGIADFRKLIIRLNKENKQTFLVSSHILSELSLMAHRFGFIDKGHLLKEITAEELHQACQHALAIKTNDAQKAYEILKDSHPTVTINEKNELLIKEFEQDKVDDIAQTLFDNGLRISKLCINETTLEDYFLNLIGGNQHA